MIDDAYLSAAWPPMDPERMMNEYLMNQVDAALAHREEAYEALETQEEILSHQDWMRERLVHSLGGWPERTPLNARVVGELPRDGYRVEKVIFESQPGHEVTANLYLPDGPGPHSAVLVPCGHTTNGKAAEIYQRVCILLALKGLAAFCYDPIGQGERYQVLDDQGQPIYGPTTEHTIVGIGSILLGTNTARYRIWDGMRALDYLESRQDIRADGFGCTGNSGGGTLTTYLMALDSRVACAAPSCFLTSLRRLLKTLGPQDAEQNIYGDIAYGIDHAEYVIMRAPKPTLICTATEDFFDIQGAWNTFREAKRIYTRLGAPERVSLVETDATHGFSLRLREAAVAWMRRWLLGIDEPLSEPDFSVLSEEALQCTESGQVMTDKDAVSVFEINRSLAKDLAETRPTVGDVLSQDELLARIRLTAHIRSSAELPEIQITVASSLPRQGYQLERWWLNIEEGIWLEALAFLPQEADEEVYLYVDGRGKEAITGESSPLAELARQGHLAVALDVRGIGEPALGRLHKNAFLAYRLGKSYLGLRADDIQSVARYLQDAGEDDSANRVHLVATGETGPAALHAAALEPDLFASVTLERSLISWANVVEIGDVPLSHLVNMVHDALATYDLPDLVDLLGTKVELVEPVNALGEPVSEEPVSEEPVSEE